MKKDSIPKVDIGKAIRQKIGERGTTVAWLARQVNCNRGNLHRHLQKEYIYPELLEKISIALKTDFFVLHSNYVINQIAKNEQNTNSSNAGCQNDNK